MTSKGFSLDDKIIDIANSASEGEIENLIDQLVWRCQAISIRKSKSEIRRRVNELKTIGKIVKRGK